MAKCRSQSPCDGGTVPWRVWDERKTPSRARCASGQVDGLTADQLNITDKAAEATFTRARARIRRLADNFGKSLGIIERYP
jgi:hypothetical protein